MDAAAGSELGWTEHAALPAELALGIVELHLVTGTTFGWRLIIIGIIGPMALTTSTRSVTGIHKWWISWIPPVALCTWRPATIARSQKGSTCL